MTTTIELSELRLGDVLLHRGSSQISKLVSWVGDSPHSHAALYDGAQIIEAGIPRVTTTDIRKRAADVDNVEFIEVYRWKDSAQHKHLSAVIERARHYLQQKTPYGLDGLKASVVAVLLRRKVAHRVGFIDSLSLPVKRVVLELLGWAIAQDDPTHVVCTELVYRSFNEADVEPEHLMRPEFVPQGPIEREWDINTFDLVKEMWDLLYGRTEDPSADSDSIAPQTSDAELDQALRDHLATLEGRVYPFAAADSDVAFPVNPQTVIPLDFQTSPSFVLLGRLARS